MRCIGTYDLLALTPRKFCHVLSLCMLYLLLLLVCIVIVVQKLATVSQTRMDPQLFKDYLGPALLFQNTGSWYLQCMSLSCSYSMKAYPRGFPLNLSEISLIWKERKHVMNSHVQYCNLLKWRHFRVFSISIPVPVNWNFVVILPCFVIFKNIVHSLEPDETLS